jgi:hypothetical protein
MHTLASRASHCLENAFLHKAFLLQVGGCSEARGAYVFDTENIHKIYQYAYPGLAMLAQYIFSILVTHQERA